MGRSIRPYDEGDVMGFCFSAGGAGYGDPLEADPEAVAQDFVDGLISAWTMREIYKVAYDEAEELVLAEETERLRAAEREARRGARQRTGTTFDAAWSQLSPPEDLLVWFGSWPEGTPDGAGDADVSALEAALAGRPIDRPLLAPLFAALAAEVEELDVDDVPGRPRPPRADLRRPRALAARPTC